MRLRRFTRSPVLFWLAAAGLAVTTGSAVSRLVGDAADDAARFGSLKTAVVAVRAVDIGAAVTDADVEVRRVPAAFLPAGVLSRLPRDRVAVSPLFAGQPVVRQQLSPDGLRGVAALLPPGTSAVGVPTGGVAPPVRLGDTVDVLATFEGDASSEEPTFPVATGARVVDVGEDVITVAVLPEEARRVAFAVAHGVVSVAVTG